MVDQRSRCLRGDCDYDFHHRDCTIQQNDEDEVTA